MRNEFLFKVKGHKDFMSLTDLITQMTEIISNRVVDDFHDLDKVMVEVFDNRQAELASHGSLGKMPLPVAVQKFR
jgi:hypothetical protein